MPRGCWTRKRGQEEENSWRRGISQVLPRVLQVLTLAEEKCERTTLCQEGQLLDRNPRHV
ncbi:hypothetical protein Taro_019041 [Colocasia esculenta]|uniref:Uncharacterized protein n=1 Tax=Colocasia esculenta TaxID=4460 RepID=A0A843UVC1_COLES|nr:hypothetical protein [Colocasia esculenta]